MTPFSYTVEPGRYLYHYTGWERAVREILPSGLIRMGLFRYTNDPRENKEWMFQLGGHTASEGVSDWTTLNAEANRLAKATTKLLCLSRDDPNFNSDSVTSIFERGFAHSRMWAQYGGGHTGVCLVFDAELLAQAIRAASAEDALALYVGQVVYSDSSEDDPLAFMLDHDKVARFDLETAVREHVRRYHQKLFFRKSLDWANEWEYRWVVHGKSEDPLFVPISEALSGICLGEGFPLAEVDPLRELLAPSETPIAQLAWTNGRPRRYQVDPPPTAAVVLDNRIVLGPDIVIRLSDVDFAANRESFELLADDLETTGIHAEVEPEEDTYAHWPAANPGIHIRQGLDDPEVLTLLEQLINQRITAKRFGREGAQEPFIPIYDHNEEQLALVELPTTAVSRCLAHHPTE